jgi:DNA-binding response OmpR family regulator
LESFGALPRLFTQAEPPLSGAVAACDAILVNVRAENQAAGWLSKGSAQPEPPMILVGARDCIMALHPTIQARARDFLIGGWQPEEAMMRVKYAISRAQPEIPIVAADEPAPQNESGPGNWRVLIADDDEIVVAQLKFALEAIGMQCWTASSGYEAQSVTQAAVIDVNMPGKSGFELLTDIRSSGKPMCVLLLTAAGGEENIVRGFNMGADDYMVKPVSTGEIAARLKRLLAAAAQRAIQAPPPQAKVRDSVLTGRYTY